MENLLRLNIKFEVISVVDNSFQMSQLSIRLWERTKSGTISWEQLSRRYSYQTRLGDFVVLVSGNGPLPNPSANLSAIAMLGSGLTSSVNIKVKRLDGRDVGSASVGTIDPAGVNALGPGIGNTDVLNPEGSRALLDLYGYLSSRNSDLDELLKELQ